MACNLIELPHFHAAHAHLEAFVGTSSLGIQTACFCHQICYTVLLYQLQTVLDTSFCSQPDSTGFITKSGAEAITTLKDPFC